MVVIIVTGGIGAGKSLAAECFRANGAVVLDADEIAHECTQRGTPAFEAIVREFGDGVLCADGEIDRTALARHAFDSRERTHTLNSIVHPAVTAEIARVLDGLRRDPRAPRAVVVEVPLLVEAPSIADLADVVLAIAANPDLRLGRAVAAGLDANDAARRIELQASDLERAQIADHVIANEGTPGEFVAKLAAFWDEVIPRSEQE